MVERFEYSGRRADVQAGGLVRFGASSRAHSMYQALRYHWR